MSQWSEGVLSRLAAATNGDNGPEPGVEPVEAPQGATAGTAPDWRAWSGRPAQLDIDGYQDLRRRHGARRPWALRALLGRDPLAGRVADATDRIVASVITGRRVAVVAATGGAGATTITTLVARSIATFRPDRTLVVAGAADHGSLAARLGVEAHRTERTTHQALDHLGPATACQMDQVLPADDGLIVLAGHDGDPRELRQVVASLGSACALSVVDAGRHVDHPCLADAHAILVVAPVTLDGAAAGQATAATLRQLWPHARLLLVSNQRSQGDGLPSSTHTATLARVGEQVMALPYDRHLAGGARLEASRLSEKARLAGLELAGTAVSLANGSQVPRG